MIKTISLDMKLGILSDRIFQSYVLYLNTCSSYSTKDGPEIFFENYKKSSQVMIQLKEKNWDKVWSAFLFLLKERGNGRKRSQK